jgi:tektin-3
MSDWRPAIGYENVDVTPLPAHPTTNQLVQPCFVPSGMSTEPLNFPNLVTGFEVNFNDGKNGEKFIDFN